ncbi:ABC transporter permease [Nocardioides alkalitolerans]|uniref:ABC transporter permease n=1 Tax=Nocardioides alkalitolerans TaxID=281714 RepID=UPI0003F688B9|nr:ABC transporter permease [Nocardioides alkalitolerans]
MTAVDTPVEQTAPPSEQDIPRTARFFTLSNVSLLFIWAVLIAVFGLLTPETFLTTDTFRTVLAGQAITAIMALALLMPIAAAQFDLSIAGSMGLGIVLVATFMAKLELGVPLAIGLTLLSGVVIGLVNAFIVVGLRVNSFIATLGTGSILVAAIQWISGGQQIVAGIPQSFTDLGRHEVLGIPMSVVFMVLIAVVMWYVLELRQTGRYLYAIGSNTEAARLAGVRVNRLTTIALVVSGLIASAAGIVFVMRIGSASLDAGTPYLLPAFAAAFLGATQFRQGNVNVLGTLVAVYVLATGVKGVQLIGAPFWVDDLFNGAALIIAVALAVRSGRQKALV